MPIIAQAELLLGVALITSPKRRRVLQRLYEQTIEAVTEILPITTPVAERFVAITLDLRRKGQPIPTNDIWIAAIAQAHELILVSSDAQFAAVEGLIIENWTQA